MEAVVIKTQDSVVLCSENHAAPGPEQPEPGLWADPAAQATGSVQQPVAPQVVHQIKRES